MASDDKVPEDEPDWGPVIVKFLDDHKAGIDDMLREWGKGGQRRGRSFIAVIVFLAGIVAGTGYLTILGVLPGEAFTFLVGTILIYLFNLLGPRFQVS